MWRGGGGPAGSRARPCSRSAGLLGSRASLLAETGAGEDPAGSRLWSGLVGFLRSEESFPAAAGAAEGRVSESARDKARERLTLREVCPEALNLLRLKGYVGRVAAVLDQLEKLFLGAIEDRIRLLYWCFHAQPLDELSLSLDNLAGSVFFDGFEKLPKD